MGHAGRCCECAKWDRRAVPIPVLGAPLGHARAAHNSDSTEDRRSEEEKDELEGASGKRRTEGKRAEREERKKRRAGRRAEEEEEKGEKKKAAENQPAPPGVRLRSPVRAGSPKAAAAASRILGCSENAEEPTASGPTSSPRARPRTRTRASRTRGMRGGRRRSGPPQPPRVGSANAGLSVSVGPASE